MHLVWVRHAGVLRRADALRLDLLDVGVTSRAPRLSLDLMILSPETNEGLHNLSLQNK